MSMGVTSTFSGFVGFADGLGGFEFPLVAGHVGSCPEEWVDDFARLTSRQSRLRVVVEGRSRMPSKRYVRTRTVITGTKAGSLISISCFSPLETQLSTFGGKSSLGANSADVP
jgi:hypothetical protein